MLKSRARKGVLTLGRRFRGREKHFLSIGWGFRGREKEKVSLGGLFLAR